MARRVDGFESESELTTRQRLLIFSNTNVTAETCLAIDESAITLEFLKTSGVKPSNLIAAGMGPKALVRMGFNNASDLKEFGFDALYLTDCKFCTEANATFGAAKVVNAFLKTAADAVSFAGSEAFAVLHITPQQLLEVCVAAPVEAAAVIEQLPRGTALEGVACKTLLDSGIRKQALLDNGYSPALLIAHCRATPPELSKLGFNV